jgi:cell division GTPase FtsZ
VQFETPKVLTNFETEEGASIKRASGLLISFTGSKDLTLFEVDKATSRIRDFIYHQFFGFFVLPLMQIRSAVGLLPSATACHFPAPPRLQWLT